MAPKRRAKERTTQPTPFPRTNVVSREREGGDIGEEIHTQEVEMRGVEDLPPLPQREGRVPLAHGAIAHQPDSTRKIDTIPDSAPTR